MFVGTEKENVDQPIFFYWDFQAVMPLIGCWTSRGIVKGFPVDDNVVGQLTTFSSTFPAKKVIWPNVRFKYNFLSQPELSIFIYIFIFILITNNTIIWPKTRELSSNETVQERYSVWTKPEICFTHLTFVWRNNGRGPFLFCGNTKPRPLRLVGTLAKLNLCLQLGRNLSASFEVFASTSF